MNNLTSLASYEGSPIASGGRGYRHRRGCKKGGDVGRIVDDHDEGYNNLYGGTRRRRRKHSKKSRKGGKSRKTCRRSRKGRKH